MGCDVHMYAEVRKGDVWEKVGDVFSNPYYEEDSKSPYNYKTTEHPWVERNYSLFAMLANVRNGLGQGRKLKPLAEPRGLPIDVSASVEAEANEWGENGHSHSWFTLAELLAADWVGQQATLQGVFDEKEYDTFKRITGKAESYSLSVSGPGVVTVSEEAYKALLRYPELRSHAASYYVRCVWQNTYANLVKEFLEQTLPVLQTLGTPEDVRIVFWFDS